MTPSRFEWRSVGSGRKGDDFTIAWKAAKSNGGMPEPRRIFASATVPSAMMKKRTVRLPFQPSRASSGTSQCSLMRRTISAA